MVHTSRISGSKSTNKANRGRFDSSESIGKSSLWTQTDSDSDEYMMKLKEGNTGYYKNSCRRRRRAQVQVDSEDSDNGSKTKREGNYKKDGVCVTPLRWMLGILTGLGIIFVCYMLFIMFQWTTLGLRQKSDA